MRTSLHKQLGDALETCQQEIKEANAFILDSMRYWGSLKPNPELGKAWMHRNKMRLQYKRLDAARRSLAAL